MTKQNHEGAEFLVIKLKLGMFMPFLPTSQLQRAQQAATLPGQGVPILDAVYQLGYADQPHLTRSLKRFYGQTPAQTLRDRQPG